MCDERRARPELFGVDLSEQDLGNLGARWITPELAEAAGLRRVDSATGAALVGRNKGDFAGIAIPYHRPGGERVREYRLRRDRPELERSGNGELKERGKYIAPPGRGNMIYFPPKATAAQLEDSGLPLVIAEGEFKTLALWRLAHHEAGAARFLPVGLAGVWNWRGTIGKVTGPDGERRDEKGAIPDLDCIAWSGRRVCIAYDADAANNPKVKAARWQLTSELMARGASVGVLEWPAREGKGVDDWLANRGPEAVLAALEGVTYGDWRARLIRKSNGDLRPCVENAALFFDHHPDWRGVLGYNEFSGAYVFTGTPPPPCSFRAGDELEDHFDVEAVRWLERKGCFLHPDAVRRVVDGAARKNTFNPVRTYLEGLKWDGIGRLDDWLTLYAGAEGNEYTRSVARCFLLSAVARVMKPGCKVDHSLILEGAQGTFKSTLVRVLAGDAYYTDQLADLGSKDAAMQLRGVWIVEVSELDVLMRAESSTAKAFFSQSDDRFRLPYGRRIVTVPRQCAFIGTTNQDIYLKDATGNRRFWPVKTGKIHIEELTRDRDQLWAESVHRFRAGEAWHLQGEVVQAAAEEAEARLETDPWQSLVERFVRNPDQRRDFSGHPVEPFDSNPNDVTVFDVLVHGIGAAPDRINRAMQMRVASCLKLAGLVRVRPREDGKRVWRYVRP